MIRNGTTARPKSQTCRGELAIHVVPHHADLRVGDGENLWQATRRACVAPSSSSSSSSSSVGKEGREMGDMT
jgi:hypothetical protein